MTLILPISDGTSTQYPHPITAPWALAQAAAIGTEFLAMLLLERSAVRRQAIFCALAVRSGDHAGAVSPGADFLLTARPQAIVERAFGFCPDTFIGGLRRVGLDAYADRSSYRRLFDLYADRANRARLKTSRHIGPLTEERVAVLHVLDPVLVRLKLVEKIETVSDAIDLNAALATIRSCCASATDDALQASLNALGSSTTVPQFLEAWLRRCHFPPPPVLSDHSAGVTAITTASDLVATGRKLRLCVGRAYKMAEAIAGRVYYYVFQVRGAHPVTVELRPLSVGGWVVASVNGFDNRPVRGVVRRRVQGWFADRGVGSPADDDLPAEWRKVVGVVGGGWDLMAML